jgi:hypothetical protein
MFYLICISLILATVNAQYNNARISIVTNVTCGFTSQNATLPTYTLTVNAQVGLLNVMNVPYINCVNTASQATYNSVNNWTSIWLDSSTIQYNSIVTMETLTKCLNVTTNGTINTMAVALNYNVSVLLTGLLEQSGQCGFIIISNNTGSANTTYNAGSTLYTASLLSTTWINNNTQLQFSLQTCIVKALNLTTYLYAPVATSLNGTGYNITFSSNTATCSPYPGQDGCCQVWTGVSSAIIANNTSWVENLNFTMISNYALMNNTMFYLSITLVAVKPVGQSSVVANSLGVSISMYGDSGLTIPATTIYNGNRVYATISLSPVHDCNTYVEQIMEVDICYSGNANVSISGCSDVNAVLNQAYLPSGQTPASVALWSPSLSYMTGCTSQILMSWTANILGPTAAYNSSIPMYAKITYYYTKNTGYGFRRSKITSDPLVYEYRYNVECPPGTAWDVNKNKCLRPSDNASIIILSIIPAIMLFGLCLCCGTYYFILYGGKKKIVDKHEQ